ncbi:ABC-2 type transporter [Paenibacillus curdlanolyticus YK9]|uniref:ABC-2 type transporter n=1 Tax=Paenibacillus curdlanolyticus YK9 TaxID=717606 RepID=E0I3M7_9BACL|nr:ABC transporter permease [Paenibacillus curdlanolyticus]EFM12891.1 ABC-2 type transporter [Paenibacillus curdlanolyticus YK9]
MSSLVIAGQLVRRMLGTRKDIFFSLLLPAIVLAVIIGFVASQQDRAAVIEVTNKDQGSFGKAVVERLQQEKKFTIKWLNDETEEQRKESVMDEKADAAIFIPANYSSQLLSGKQPKLAMYRMNEQLWNASLALSLQAETARQHHAALLLQSSHALNEHHLTALLDKREQLIRADQTPTALGIAKEQPITVGIMLLFVLILATRSISLVMEDREKRTMARMFAAPVRAVDIAVGNFLGSVATGTMQLLIMVGLSCYAFGYDPGFSPAMLFLVLECFLFAAVGLCSAIAGLVRNGIQLGQISNLIITPTCMISGCFWPVSFMPDYMQKLANATPQLWAIEAINRLSMGHGLHNAVMPILILVLFAAVLLAFGAVVLRPSRGAIGS